MGVLTFPGTDRSQSLRDYRAESMERSKESLREQMERRSHSREDAVLSAVLGSRRR